MKKTENFALSQWEAHDPIRREDFNADNAAIDAALKEATSVSGSYTMTMTSGVKVDLGFRPELVLLVASGNRGYGMAVLMDGIGFYAAYDNSTYNMNAGNCSAVVNSTGFTVPANCMYFNDIVNQKCYYTVVR